MMVIKNAKVRRALNILLPCVALPAAVLAGNVLTQHHLAVAFGVAVLALAYFVTGFERKTTGSRRMVIVAVMTALCVAGRFIPLFKPVTALTVITAMYLGGEAGFLTGALSALMSNFYFGHGPWTPFQMLAWGMIGLLAGLLHKPLKKHRALLLLFGVVCGVAYSMVMDVWTVTWYAGGLDGKLYMAAVLAALPHTVLYGLSNLLFLWVCAKPFGEKLERVCLKYGV